MFVVAFLLFYGTANLYLFYRFTSAFSVAKIPVACVWLLLALFSMVFRNDSDLLPNNLTDIFYVVGAYWIVAVYYAVFFTLLCDIVSKIRPFEISSKTVALFICVIVFSLVTYGAINAKNITVKNYAIDIDKRATNDKMRVVLISDLHLGKVHNGQLVKDVVNKINELNPQVVLIAGDIIDSDFNSVYRQNSLKEITNIKSPYGIYAVMGNHEYIGGQEQSAREYFAQNGIKNVLVEQSTSLPNGVLLFGKDDYSKNKSLEAIFTLSKEANKSPVILITHQPRYIEEISKMNVDLLLAGHTHLGQNYPNNYIVENMYSLAYGYELFGKLQAIVTSGVGTWGPPVRIGTKAEIVCIDISFK